MNASVRNKQPRQEVLQAHLLEYQKVFETILQLRDQHQRITNYGLLAFVAILAVAGTLYKDGSLPNIFWLIDFGGFWLFVFLIWQHLYVDRTMFRLSDYVMNFLSPAIRDTLKTGFNTDSNFCTNVMRFHEYFFRIIKKNPERNVLRGSHLGDLLFGGARYAVPLFGGATSLAALAFGYIQYLVGEAGTKLQLALWASSLVLGLVAFIATLVGITLVAEDVRRLWSQKPPP